MITKSTVAGSEAELVQDTVSGRPGLMNSPGAGEVIVSALVRVERDRSAMGIERGMAKDVESLLSELSRSVGSSEIFARRWVALFSSLRNSRKQKTEIEVPVSVRC